MEPWSFRSAARPFAKLPGEERPACRGAPLGARRSARPHPLDLRVLGLLVERVTRVPAVAAALDVDERTAAEALRTGLRTPAAGHPRVTGPGHSLPCRASDPGLRYTRCPGAAQLGAHG